METTIIITVCVLGLLVFGFYDCKKSRAENEAKRQKREAEYQKDAEIWKKETEKQKLIEACKQTDINKMVWLLEKGIDPNTIVQVWVDEYWSNPPEYCDCSHYENRTLLDITHSPAAKKLLRAYGAKTIKEIMEEEAAIEKARNDAKVAEIRRQEAILQAEKKAKEEANMRKVEAFLASKKA